MGRGRGRGRQASVKAPPVPDIHVVGVGASPVGESFIQTLCGRMVPYCRGRHALANVMVWQSSDTTSRMRLRVVDEDYVTTDEFIHRDDRATCRKCLWLLDADIKKYFAE